MITLRPLLLVSLCVFIIGVCGNDRTVHKAGHDVDLPGKIELFEGVALNIPDSNSTEGRLFSLEVDTGVDKDEGRKKKKKGLEKLLPLFILPFLLQSAIVPLFLGLLKFMLFKAMMVGKLALGLILLNAFKNHNTVKGRDAEMADVHYGYHGNGMEEYGAYIN